MTLACIYVVFICNVYLFDVNKWLQVQISLNALIVEPYKHVIVCCTLTFLSQLLETMIGLAVLGENLTQETQSE